MFFEFLCYDCVFFGFVVVVCMSMLIDVVCDCFVVLLVSFVDCVYVLIQWDIIMMCLKLGVVFNEVDFVVCIGIGCMLVYQVVYWFVFEGLLFVMLCKGLMVQLLLFDDIVVVIDVWCINEVYCVEFVVCYVIFDDFVYLVVLFDDGQVCVDMYDVEGMMEFDCVFYQMIVVVVCNVVFVDILCVLYECLLCFWFVMLFELYYFVDVQYEYCVLFDWLFVCDVVGVCVVVESYIDLFCFMFV